MTPEQREKFINRFKCTPEDLLNAPTVLMGRAEEEGDEIATYTHGSGNLDECCRIMALFIYDNPSAQLKVFRYLAEINERKANPENQ